MWIFATSAALLYTGRALQIIATTKYYIKFVCKQLKTPLPVTYRKMFGEYMVYVDGKPVLLVCDNTIFVKKLPDTAALLPDADCGFPYDGAKEHYVLDVENEDLTSRVVDALVAVTPVPKKKKR